jgi:hypothetical protein
VSVCYCFLLIFFFINRKNFHLFFSYSVPSHKPLPLFLACSSPRVRLLTKEEYSWLLWKPLTSWMTPNPSFIKSSLMDVFLKLNIYQNIIHWNHSICLGHLHFSQGKCLIIEQLNYNYLCVQIREVPLYMKHYSLSRTKKPISSKYFTI